MKSQQNKFENLELVKEIFIKIDQKKKMKILLF
jgi:hypothetical protein